MHILSIRRQPVHASLAADTYLRLWEVLGPQALSLLNAQTLSLLKHCPYSVHTKTVSSSIYMSRVKQKCHTILAGSSLQQLMLPSVACMPCNSFQSQSVNQVNQPANTVLAPMTTWTTTVMPPCCGTNQLMHLLLAPLLFPCLVVWWLLSQQLI
jgi:hypothetical protein